MLLKLLCILFLECINLAYSQITKEELDSLRDRAKLMFQHAYDGYNKYAYPFDELRPLTCDGRDTWGGYSLTLVDSLDTLVMMGNYTEFRKAAEAVLTQLKPDKNVNVSVFETNIRAHLLSKRANFSVSPSWPCSGRLLDLAERFADKLLPAFDTETGMPYGTVNLEHGVPQNETPVTCVAGIGTFIVEFGVLSRLTGDQRYEKAALRALKSMWYFRSEIGLLGNHIDVQSGRWTAHDSTIGSGTDSIFEYLVKGSALFRIPELHAMFLGYKKSIDDYLLMGDWHFIVNKDRGGITMPVFQSLDAFWPSVLVNFVVHMSIFIKILAGDVSKAVEHILVYHKVWKKYGFLPEMYNVVSGIPINARHSYPLRPEFIESVLYAYQATKDPEMLKIGRDVLHSIETSAKTKCGYATVNNVKTHALENRMESFFLAETTKYLYLLFSEDNFMHDEQNANSGYRLVMPSGKQCRWGAGGYIYNTEAHPIDPGALECCSIGGVASRMESMTEEIKSIFNAKTDKLINDIDDIFLGHFAQYGLSKNKHKKLTFEKLLKMKNVSRFDQSTVEVWHEFRETVSSRSNKYFSGTAPGSNIYQPNKKRHEHQLNHWMASTVLYACPYPSFTDTIFSVSSMRSL